MPDRPASHYIHGTVAEEQQRLALMNELINDGCLRELAPAPGARMLDVGCGLAQFARRMARAAAPGGTVVGVERDAAQRAEARRLAEAAGEADLVELREGDALDLPLDDDEWGTFDLAHARFILEHVPDPLGVVRQMARALRPGGRLILADDDHDVFRLWPEPPGFGSLWAAYVRSYDRLGNDPYVGRRLVALLHEAGVQPVRTTWVFYGGCAGQPAFDAYVTNLAGVLRGACPTVVALGLLDAAYADAALAAFTEWGRRPDAALWYGINWAEGMVNRESGIANGE